MYFKKRIPEPKEMGEIEMSVFEKESKKSYKRWIVPLVDDALTVLPKTSLRILDVGCGPGLLTKEFASRSKKFKVVGIDLSTSALEMAKKNCIRLKNVSFRYANVSKMPFNSQSFDLVVCKDSIHHFSNVKKAIKEMHRVLNKGGILYMQDLRRDVPWYLLKTSIPLKTTFQKLQYYSVRAAYTKEEIKKILSELSLRYSKVKSRKITNKIAQKYRRLGINMDQLRAGFQARYIVSIKK